MFNVLMSGTVLAGVLAAVGCNQSSIPSESMSAASSAYLANYNAMGIDTATFGSGCFWCTEAVFQQLDGVLKVTSGYSGGHVANPTYEEVCSKTTGHAEVIQLVYDPNKVSFDELLEIFWKTHDPTTLNRQGNDIGPQYRSAIFYHSDEQRERSEFFKKQLDASGAFDRPIVTEIAAFKNFYAAEAYHQNFYSNNPNYGYCSYIIRPKLEKFEKAFKDKLRKNNSNK